jgi:hypothetical protein
MSHTGIMESTSSSKGTIGDKRVVAALIASVTGSGRDALLSLPMPSRIRDMAFHWRTEGVIMAWSQKVQLRMIPTLWFNSDHFSLFPSSQYFGGGFHSRILVDCMQNGCTEYTEMTRGR